MSTVRGHVRLDDDPDVREVRDSCHAVSLSVMFSDGWPLTTLYTPASGYVFHEHQEQQALCYICTRSLDACPSARPRNAPHPPMSIVPKPHSHVNTCIQPELDLPSDCEPVGRVQVLLMSDELQLDELLCLQCLLAGYDEVRLFSHVASTVPLRSSSSERGHAGTEAGHCAGSNACFKMQAHQDGNQINTCQHQRFHIW